MLNIYCSADMTAFTSTRQFKDWFVGEVRLVFGPKALRIVHECLALRDTAAEAELDASRDARKLIRMWADQARL